MGSSSSQVIGYRYFMGLHMAICHGPVDSMDQIFVGKRSLGITSQTSNTTIFLNKPELFGGDKKEGGILGDLDIEFGAGDQTVNPYLAEQFGITTPAFRGTTCVVFKKSTQAGNAYSSASGGGYLASMSPYPKAWAFQVTDIPGGNFNPTKQNINGSANGAHIIYDCLTDSDFGLGISGGDIDSGSFTLAGDTLFTENFGLSFIYAQQSSMEDFIKEVLTHINAVLYTDRKTGKFVLILIRDDYVVGDLPIFNETNIASLINFERPALGEMVNEIVLSYRKKGNFEDTTITIQDLASVQAQAGIISQTVSFNGIDTDELASLIGQRELKQSTTPLARVKFVANREAWNVNPGGVIKLVWGAYGIVELLVRVVAVDYGTFEDGLVRVEGVEDIFGLPTNTYLTPTPTEWEDEVVPPQPAASTLIIEAPYFVVATQASQDILSELVVGASLLQAIAENPPVSAFSFQLQTKINGASYAPVGDSSFAPTALLASTLGLETKVGLVIKDFRGSSSAVVLGGYAFINDEILRIDSVDVITGLMDVGRGYLDTIPRSHPTDSIIYFADNHSILDPAIYVTSDIVNAKVLPQTGIAILTLGDATEDTLTMVGRREKPYPPSRVKINGGYYPTDIEAGIITVTWSHQDRLQQLVPGGDDWYTVSLGAPEEGVLYTVRYYNNDTSTLLFTDFGINGKSSSFTVSVATGVSFVMRVEVESIRDGTVGALTVFSYTFNYAKALEVRVLEDTSTRSLENGDRRILEI